MLTADLKGGDGDVLTYTTVAVGVDAAIVTRRAELAGTIRYEHRFGESGGLSDADILSGLVRGRLEAAQGLNLEAGALATRARADGQGADGGFFIGGGTNVADLYSFYAGPTFDLIGKRYTDFANTYSVGSYGLLGARIGYSASHWDVFAEGRNLLDRVYVATVVVKDRASANTEMLYPGTPRSVFVGAHYRF